MEEQRLSWAKLFRTIIFRWEVPRIRRASLQLLGRLLDQGEVTFKSIISYFKGELIELLIKVAQNLQINMHEVLLSVSILVKLSVDHLDANNWVLNRGQVHEFARVKELCLAYAISRESLQSTLPSSTGIHC